MNKTGYSTIWQVVRSSGSSGISYADIKQKVRKIDGVVTANIGNVVRRLTKVGVLSSKGSGSYERFTVKQEWQGSELYDATPKKLRDGSWGACVDTPTEARKPTSDDLVIVTTRMGKVFYPRRIVRVDDTFPKMGRTTYVCRSSDIVQGYNPPSSDDSDNSQDSQGSQDSQSSQGSQSADGSGTSPEEMEKIVKELLEKEGQQGQPPPEMNIKLSMDDSTKEQVEKLIQEEVEKQVAERVKPQVIEVNQPDTPTVKIEGAHYMFERLLKLVAGGFHVFMWGPPGTGKTTAALQVAEALSREAEIDTLDPTTARSMIQGYMTPTGDHVHNVFTRCWEQGKIYVADEVDLAPGHVQTLFNSALANNMAPLAWGNISKADGFGFVATGNTSGRPTAAFPDRRPMSNAFADRLYFLYWPLDPSIECRAVGLPSPMLPSPDRETCDPQDWVTFVQLLREWAADNAPTLQVTPRASLLGIQALALGENPSAVADALIFRGCDDELRAKALLNVSWR